MPFACALPARRAAMTNANVNGTITNFDLRPGDYVNAGKPVTALVDTDTLRVDAYFEETKLPYIKIGDNVHLRVMGESGMILGHVGSIAGGIEDRERQDGGDLLANVNPVFTWVRLAQRLPVRVELDQVPKELLLATGRTVTVSILSDQATRRD